MWALPSSVSQVRSLHFSCLIWLIADFLFRWGHEFKPQEGSCLDRHFPPSPWSLKGTCQKMCSVLACLARTGSASGDLYRSFPTATLQLWEGEGRFLPPPAPCFLPRFPLATPALSSEGAKVLYRQVFSSATATTLIGAVRDARRYLSQLKTFPISKREHLASGILSASNIFQVLTVTWCLFFFTPFNRGCHFLHLYSLKTQHT